MKCLASAVWSTWSRLHKLDSVCSCISSNGCVCSVVWSVRMALCFWITWSGVEMFSGLDWILFTSSVWFYLKRTVSSYLNAQRSTWYIMFKGEAALHSKGSVECLKEAQNTTQTITATVSQKHVQNTFFVQNIISGFFLLTSRWRKSKALHTMKVNH